MSDWVSE